MNPSFIVYSFLERFSTKWNAYPLTFSSKQDMFIKNFNANCNTIIFIFFLSFDFGYLLTRAICLTSNGTYKSEEQAKTT